MCNKLSYILIVMFVINVAKSTSDQHDSIKSTTTKIFSEAGQIDSRDGTHSEHNNQAPLSRVKGRKGVEDQMNSTNSNINPTSSSSSTSTTTILATTKAETAVVLSNKTEIVKNSTESAGSSLNSTTKTLSTEKSTPTTTTTTVKSTTLSTTTTTTTKKPKKPSITFSAEDEPKIIENEKKIKFINGNNDPPPPPELGSDTDKAIDEENRARRSYALFIGVAFGLPMTFTLIHILYKRFKAYLEVRHYQRVDFLVDGMYIS